MKLHKRLTINGEPVPLIEEDVNLFLNSNGNAYFTVQSDKAQAGIVELALGYAPDKLIPLFKGFIATCQTINSEQQGIFCREMPAVLDKKVFLNLRHPTLEDVLAEISGLSRLSFVCPEGITKRVPYFYSIGNGLHCLDSIATVFGIDDGIWQLQPDGNVFIGSWHNSPWAKASFDIKNKWLTGFGKGDMATIPYVPHIRPGAELKGLGIILHLRLQGVHLSVQWGKL